VLRIAVVVAIAFTLESAAAAGMAIHREHVKRASTPDRGSDP
jgi:hypothetical protein